MIGKAKPNMKTIPINVSKNTMSTASSIVWDCTSKNSATAVNKRTIEATIAIPATDTTTRDALAAILDAITGPAGFDALADDAAGADTDPDVSEPTEDQTVDTDGIA